MIGKIIISLSNWHNLNPSEDDESLYLNSMKSAAKTSVTTKPHQIVSRE